MIKGKGISEGIGIGRAFVLKKQEIKVENYKIENTSRELEKLNVSLNSIIQETEKSIEILKENSNNEQIQILEAYLMILKDETLIEKTVQLIEKEKLNVVYAVEKGLNEVITNFKNIPDEYISERANDIEDIKNRIISKLLKIEENDFSSIEPNTIIVTQEFTTSDTAKINMKNVSGIISEIGGTNSHVSIIARNKQIPMVIRIENLQDKIKNGDTVIVNGNTGEIYINPSIEELQRYKEKQDIEKNKLEQYKDKVAITKDGYQVEICCNIGKPNDLENAINVGADGVGLFRTEFLFMDSEQMPSEEEQFENYKKIAEVMKDKLSIIRTLDAGGDKNIPYLNLEKEENPFLGYRAIRICLGNPEIFKVQLRAILRASAYGNVAIMFPMISVIDELREAKAILEECKKELDNENIKYNKSIKVGMMIEIPASAIMAEIFAKECDFFSIGTNDLIQYTVAAERGNPKIANLYTKNHPAVIKLIKNTIDSAHKNGIFCGMCGEAASNFQYIPLLIGMGLNEFSMNSSSVLQAKKTITELNKIDCEKLVEEVLQTSSDKEVEVKLKEFLK